GAVEELATSLRAGSEMAIRAQEALGRMSAATTDSQESITRLEEAGLEIVGIVDTITELSSQTNLLALNATIEAARAGEAGRGFAVVAKDVKDLAQLTSTSATNITTVVDQIQQRLDASGTATETISGLVAGLEADQLALTEMVSQQTETVEEISGTASSGAEGVSEIASAIRRLDAHAADLAGSSAVHR
ncbi:MAG: methyl-accepting chemotaxis protein, partial [Actinomycetota bacterium]